MILIFRLGSLDAQTNALTIQNTQITDEPVDIDLTPHIEMWIDSSGTSSFPEIRSELGDFIPYDPAQVNRYSNHHKFWLRVKICGAQKSSMWYFALIYPKVEYYQSVDGDPWVHGHYGFDVKEQESTIRLGPDLFLPIHLQQNQCHEFYFYCNPKIYANISLVTMNHFHCKLTNRSYIDELHRARAIKNLPLASILLTIFFYHLVLFAYNHENSFLYLSIFSLCMGLLILHFPGFLIELFNVTHIGPYMKIVPFTIAAMMAIASPFTISYLRLPSDGKLSKAVKILGWYWLVNSFLGIITSLLPDQYYQAITGIGDVGYMLVQAIFYPFFLFVGILVWWRGNDRAIYYLLGFGTMFIFSILGLLFLNGIIPGSHPSPLYFNGGGLWKHGATLGMLLFSFGLASQFKTLQDERAEAEKQKALADQFRILDQKEADRLRELDQFKSQLYTNITHEFRTPLTVISGMADQLPHDSHAKELIHRNADQLLDLVNQMLDLSKIDAGKLTPAISQMDVIPILKYFSEGYARFATTQIKHFQMEIMDDVLWMDIDPDLLARICHNLVHNAIKFSPQGGHVKLRVEKVEEGRKIQLKISDQGRGIPVNDLGRIFDRFYQVDASNTRHREGTGIGLSLVKEITHLLNGSISVQSKEHQGSTFTVTLPIEHQGEIIAWSPPTKRILVSANKNEKKNNLPSTAYKILIVEDHDDVRTYLTQLINTTYHVDQADNGRSGLSLAFEVIPDLIISDVMMPEMDGFEFCETIKNDPRTSHIPIILLTAKSTQEDKLDGLQGGADAYLVKPCDKRELFIRIEKLLEHREKVRQHYQQFQMLPQDEIKENRFLQKIREQIEANLSNEQYQIDDLAQGIHLGRVQLFRKLRALTGKSYTQILREMRIHRAKELLRKTNKTSSEIAFEVGFKDGSYFGKVFKKEVGINTSEFRINPI